MSREGGIFGSGGLSFFQKKVDPKEVVSKWRNEMRRQRRSLEREVQALKRNEDKVKKIVQGYAKEGDMNNAKVVAKELIFARKQRTRLMTHIANMMDMENQLTQQLAFVKVAGTLQKSTDVMQIVNKLIKAPELMQTVAEMSKEMARAGLIDEMLEETFDSALEMEDLEEETEEQVNKVLEELALETQSTLPEASKEQQQQEAQQVAAQEDEELQARMDAIRS